MLTLAGILSSKENRTFILEEATKYGFENLRITISDTPSDSLFFLVSKKKNEKGKKEAAFSSALSAIISDKFQCEVSILVDTELNEMFAETIHENSFALTNYDQKEVEAKLKKSLDKILINKIDTNPTNKAHVARGLRLAESINQQRKTFLSTEQTTSITQKDDSKRKKKGFIDELDAPENMVILKKALRELPTEMLNTLESLYENKKKELESPLSKNTVSP